MSNKKILLIEICNYDDFPIGGYLSFAKQMLSSFGNQLALVGMATDKNTPLGRWTKKEINGVSYDFFAVLYSDKVAKKGLIPSRLKAYFALRKYKNKILAFDAMNIFIQTPEALLALRIGKNKNLCVRIPGLENPLSISRYSYSKYFASFFDKVVFKELKKSTIILATGDDVAINSYLKRSNGILSSEKVVKFPSRYNSNIFKPISQLEAKKSLNLDPKINYIVTSGRISKLKGWEFMMECFIEYRKLNDLAHFIYIGDGEEKDLLSQYIQQRNISDYVTITGRVNHPLLSNYLNAASVFIMGSYAEGWSTSLVEAISCGLPIICTEFSSANDLVENNFNGYIIKDRNQSTFVEAMNKSNLLRDENLINKSNSMKRYSTVNLKKDILKLWTLK